MTDAGEPVRGGGGRPSAAFSSANLRVLWHGLFAGACVTAYLLGETSTDLHRAAGYTAIALLAVRILAAIVAPSNSVWAWPRAPWRAWAAFRRTLAEDPRRALAGRPPIVPAFGLALLVAAVAAVLSGLAADSWRADDLHEVVVNIAVCILLAHVATVTAAHFLRRRR